MVPAGGWEWGEEYTYQELVTQAVCEAPDGILGRGVLRVAHHAAKNHGGADQNEAAALAPFDHTGRGGLRRQRRQFCGVSRLWAMELESSEALTACGEDKRRK